MHTEQEFIPVAVADPGGGPRWAMAPPGPVKIGHKKDGRRRWPHRFHVSRPPLTRPLDPLLSRIRTVRCSGRPGGGGGAVCLWGVCRGGYVCREGCVCLTDVCPGGVSALTQEGVYLPRAVSAQGVYSSPSEKNHRQV